MKNGTTRLVGAAKALGIDIPATLLGRAAFCSLDGLRAQPHDAVSAFTGSVN
jgi:hypothetical protein